MHNSRFAFHIYDTLGQKDVPLLTEIGTGTSKLLEPDVRTSPLVTFKVDVSLIPSEKEIVAKNNAENFVLRYLINVGISGKHGLL